MLDHSWGGAGCSGGVGGTQWAERPLADRGEAEGGEGAEGAGAGTQWCRQNHPPQGYSRSGLLCLY